MAEKVTKMRLRVDLQCAECYKKVKKVLCKFPQIRDQEFDEKQNIVTIKVVCCNPEKMRDKLCRKGCGAIKSIEIVEPPPSPPPPRPPPPQPPVSPPRPPPRPPPPADPPHFVCCVQCSGPCFGGCRAPPPWYEGYFYARPVYDGYGGGRPCYVSRCYNQCLNEDNATGCTIM